MSALIDVEALLAEIERGFEGVPGGKWEHRVGPEDEYYICTLDLNEEVRPRTVWIGECFGGEVTKHFIRCSPDNLRAIIASYREQAARIAELERDNAALKARLDGGPSEAMVQAARFAVRDEVGSQLCMFINFSGELVCGEDHGGTCFCREVASAALKAARAVTPPTPYEPTSAQIQAARNAFEEHQYRHSSRYIPEAWAAALKAARQAGG